MHDLSTNRVEKPSLQPGFTIPHSRAEPESQNRPDLPKQSTTAVGADQEAITLNEGGRKLLGQSIIFKDRSKLRELIKNI
jgi:hypothetical protein